jgi:hypothetical protein
MDTPKLNLVLMRVAAADTADLGALIPLNLDGVPITCDRSIFNITHTMFQ